MSSAHPLRERLQSNSPDPDHARPTTPLRINKSPQPRQGLSPRQAAEPPAPAPVPVPAPVVVVPVARRSSSSFKHVRENQLVSKSPFRMMRPPGQSGAARRASGEKRARPDSMHSQAENEKPLGFKRRQSRAFQGLLQKEPVTKSPFRRNSESTDEPPPPVPPKVRPKSLPPSYIPVPSPMRGVLSSPRKMHGPRKSGEPLLPRRKTVTFDERCDVLEFDVDKVGIADVSFDEDGYGYGFSCEGGGEDEEDEEDDDEDEDEDAAMEDSFEDSIDPIANDSITGMVESMLQAALPHTPPAHEDEQDADLLPPSPSRPAPSRKSPPQRSPSPEPVREGPVHSPLPPVDRHSHSQLKDEEAPFEDSFRSVRSDDSLDPSNLSIGHSEVSINNLDTSLLAHIKIEDTDDYSFSASFAPAADSSPRARSRSGTPDRSYEARCTPVFTRSGSGSPFRRQIFKQASASSLGSLTGGGRRSPITREVIQERLLRRKSEDALSSRSATSSPVSQRPAELEDDSDDDEDTSRTTEPADDEPEVAPPLQPMSRHNPTHDGVMSIDPEPQPIDPPRPTLQERAHSIDGGRPPMDAKTAFAGLDLDFEHGFALGEEGMSVSAGLGTGVTARARHSGMHLGEVSALDKLMEDMAQGAGVDASVVSSLRVEAVTEGVRASTFALPDIEQDDEGMGFGLDGDEVPTRGIEIAPSPSPPASQRPGEDDDSDSDEDTSRTTEPADDKPASALQPMSRHNPTHDGVMSIDPEPQPIDPPRPTLQERAHSIDGGRPLMDAKTAFAGLDLDFEHGFALGEEGMSVSAGLGTGVTARARHSGMHLGEVSALDKLMEDMAQGAGVDVNASVVSSLRVETVTEGVQASTFALPDIEQDDEGMGFGLDGDEVPTRGIEIAPSPSPSPPPPPPPAKDAIRAREELIKAKKREARMREEDMFDADAASLAVPARPARRRSLSTGSVLTPHPAAVHRRTPTTVEESDDLLDITALRGEDSPLADTINRELRKRENNTRSKYHVREHTETIYASSDARTAGSSDMDSGKPWRTIRRPSDMNEHAKQLRELREQLKANKVHGKVFVKVVGLRGLEVPIPEQATKITCTLNNGIHFVTTPEAPLARECSIDQEFELIEHSKLEFTLTIKVRRDPHIVAQFKANQSPPQPRPSPQPLPPPASKGGSSRTGVRSFLFGSPKKPKTIARSASPAPPPTPAPAPPFKLPENLARYMKPDGSLGRAFITFKDIAAHCDTRLLETSFPLIGQKLQFGSTTKALQIGEVVLQIFRLPPLPGMTPEQLPQSLEECHRGLTHTRWHKACYMQGMLTQIGGDCRTWRRRHLRLIGSSLVAYNDVTKRAIATIDLRKAIGVVDEQKGVARSPASRSSHDYDDSEPYGIGGVSHSFKLEFLGDEIWFYADTDEEKTNWVNILKALIGRIPPNPLWAEVLFQRQEQARHAAQPSTSTSTPGPSSR
ncbi:hypothetical protein OH76DRAFT_1489500 [Lentinus brumalis]|uniref:PH domain-containing protein n=1 Tax=Lentinus brumalis TaxID=2498619 RepID=A0A371CMA3_9APHY|nr:hypothetical protein OH76DRAFT_1489500 [Polyporus brumalis]